MYLYKKRENEINKQNMYLLFIYCIYIYTHLVAYIQ